MKMTTSRQKGVRLNKKHHQAAPSPALLQFAIEKSVAGTVWLLSDGTHYYVNNAICRMLGYSREELLSLTAFEVNPQLTPESWAEHWAALKQAGSLSFEGHLQCRDGRVVVVSINANFLAHDGQEYNCASIRDITAYKRSDEAVRIRARQQVTVADLSRDALLGMDLGHLRNRAVRQVAGAFGVEFCVLLERLPDGSTLRPIAGVGWQEGIVGHATIGTECRSQAGYTLLSGEVVIVEDLRTETRFSPPALLVEHGVISGISVIIPGNDEPWGVLGAYSTQMRAFSLDDVDFIQSVANLLAEAMERARMEEDHRRSDRLLRIAGQAARLGGWSVDLAQERVMWSDEVCAIHAQPPGTSPTLDDAIRFYAPEWRQRITDVFRACAHDGIPYDEEMEIITADGRRIWVRTIGEAVRDAGGAIVQVQGAFQDITQSKQAEQLLSQSQRRFRDLADAMPLIVWTADVDGILDYGNREMGDYAGISNAALPSAGWLEAVHPEDRDRCMAVWGESVRTGNLYSIEFRIRCKDHDHYRWHLIRAEPIRNEAGAIVKWYGTAMDIHDRKLNEEEVERLASRLQTTLESITDAFYTVDRQWRFTYVNKKAERLLKRDRAELLGKVLWDVYPALYGTRISHEFWRARRKRCTVQFETRSPTLGTWLEVHGYPSEEGLAVYFRDISERKQADDTIRFLALYDPLTKLPNRSLIQDRLQQALSAAARSHQQGAMLLLDLDSFKALNDTLGYEQGDRLLEQAAARLTACLRKEDTVGRFGSDEFAIIVGRLGECTENAADNAAAIGEKILALFNQPYLLGGKERHITPSIGVTLFGGGPQDTVEEVLKRADFAMLQAKTGGRNMLRLFDPVMQTAVNARSELEAELREGLQRREFLPFYQQQVDGAGRLTGAEALARWHHPRRGLVSPGEFIPVAEETGLILPLGQCMLEAVCAQLATWAADPETARLTLAVNVSARQFRHPDFVAQVLDVITKTGANPQRLKLELTESLLLDDIDDTISKMVALKAKGVSFSLDDFGTGSSSLYYLKRLPLEQLKIDQRFVRGVLTDPVDAAIVRTVIVLAQSLGLGVIAEGVETEAVQECLASHGCSAYQGYLFGRPLPIEQFEAYRRGAGISA